MKRLALTIALALPQMASAQSDPFMDLTMPDMSDKTAEPSPYGCPPQERPAWRKNLSGKEVYKSRLLSAVYEAIWIRNVESSGTCNCETRAPSWDEADLIYQTLFANLDSADQSNIQLKMDAANRLRQREVDKLCNKEMQ